MPITDALGNATLKRVKVERELAECKQKVETYRFRFGELSAHAAMTSETDW